MDFTKRELQESLAELVDAVLDAIDALEHDDPEAGEDLRGLLLKYPLTGDRIRKAGSPE